MIRAQAWPPAIIYMRPAGDGRWAKQRGPVIAVPADPAPHIIAHESAHVSQWWIITALAGSALAALSAAVPGVPLAVVGVAPGVMGALLLVPGFRFEAEARAYAASARVAPDLLPRFGLALWNGYDTGRTLADCRAAITARI